MNPMKTSDAGIYALALHEGIVPGPYLDSEGVWTFGLGHAETSGLVPNPRAMPKGMPDDLDAALVEVFRVFRADLPKYEAAVNRALKVPVSQTQFDALVSFHFNTGAVAKASFVKRLNAGDMAGAVKGFMAWSRPARIIDRRKAEQTLFAKGTYPTGQVTVWGVTDAGKVIWKPVKRLAKDQVLALMDGARPTTAPQKPAKPTQTSLQKAQRTTGPALALGAVIAGAVAYWNDGWAWLASWF
jgi:lysozyme